MRINLLAILFLGFLQIYVGEIKAEEKEICYYSNPREYQKCFNKKSSLERKPKYPLTNQGHYIGNHWDIIWTKGFCANGPHACMGSVYEIVELNSLNDKELKITIGDKKTGAFGIRKRAPFTSKKEYFIKTEDFLSWKEIKISQYSVVTYVKYLISYVDEGGNKDNLKLIRFNFVPKWRTRDFMSDYFKTITGLKNGESRSIDNILNKKLMNAIKNYEIIQSVIKLPTTSKKECVEVNEIKFPDLTQRYIKLSKTINSLRAKLDLPPSNNLKPICN